MKHIITFSILSIFNSVLIAQTTLIPDNNFEQALINLGYDTGVPDGSIPTSSIDTVTILAVDSLSIQDLAGIEDFAALVELSCQYNLLTSLNVSQNSMLTDLNININQLTALDVSQNILLTNLNCNTNNIDSIDLTQNSMLASFYCIANAFVSLDFSQNTMLTDVVCSYNLLTNLDFSQNIMLTYLDCKANQLTSLDVTQNTMLYSLFCSFNLLTNLDVSQSIMLTYLYCQANLLTSLDVSQNTVLTVLNCVLNQLICLNVKNGNNDQMYLNNYISFSAGANPDLTCITVDDSIWSAINWEGYADSTASFSEDCSCFLTVNNMLNDKNQLSVYPNPTHGQLAVDLGEFSKHATVSLFNTLGQSILNNTFKNTDQINIEINAPNGIYFLRIENDLGESKMIKVIKK